jgi:hypothetical protein
LNELASSSGGPIHAAKCCLIGFAMQSRFTPLCNVVSRIRADILALLSKIAGSSSRLTDTQSGLIPVTLEWVP